MININYNVDTYSNYPVQYRDGSPFANYEEDPLSKKLEKKSSIKSPSENKDKLNIGNNELADDEKKLVEELKRIDQKVRAHEQAHLAAGGNLVRGGANFQYQKGPDGKRYAVGGEVQIDASPVPDDPERTIQKMQQVRRAALAPGDPSAQDRKVAAEASQIEMRAAMEKSQQRNNEMKPKSKLSKSNIAKYSSENSNSFPKFNRIG